MIFFHYCISVLIQYSKNISEHNIMENHSYINFMDFMKKKIIVTYILLYKDYISKLFSNSRYQQLEQNET